MIFSCHLHRPKTVPYAVKPDYLESSSCTRTELLGRRVQAVMHSKLNSGEKEGLRSEGWRVVRLMRRMMNSILQCPWQISSKVLSTGMHQILSYLPGQIARVMSLHLPMPRQRQMPLTRLLERTCSCIGRVFLIFFIEIHLIFLLRFEAKRSRKKTTDAVFTYSCAQSRSREPKAKTSKGPRVKMCDTCRMDRYDCGGWLHIAVSNILAVVDIKIKHDESHIGYLDIQLPEKWKKYIEEHARTQTPGEVC